MNGRIYDPLLGRMLSADVLVQFPRDLQSYNRYSYCQNNPLKYVDPTGFALTTATDEKGISYYKIDQDNPGNPYVTATSLDRSTKQNQRNEGGEPRGVISTGTDGAIKISSAKQASANFLDQGVDYKGDPGQDWQDGQNGQAELLKSAAVVGAKTELFVASLTGSGAMVTHGADAVDAVTDATEHPAKTAVGLLPKVLPEGHIKNAVETINKIAETKDKVDSKVNTAKDLLNAGQKIKDSKAQTPPPPPPPAPPPLPQESFQN